MARPTGVPFAGPLAVSWIGQILLEKPRNDMAQPAASSEIYSRKGFLANFWFSLALMGIGGWLTFLFAPEEIMCAREGRGEVSCQIRRLVGGIAVWEWQFEGLRIAERDAPDLTSQGIRRRGNAISQNWIRLIGRDGEMETGSSEDALEVHQAAEALNGLVNDPAQTRVQVRLGGTPNLYPWVLGGFLVGASILPFWVLGFLVHRMKQGLAG
jgi:hypothetical protein